MTISAKLVLRYHESVRPTFAFECRTDKSLGLAAYEIMNSRIKSKSFYVDGPIGKDSQYIVVKEYYNTTKNLDVKPTLQEAIDAAYNEALKFKETLFSGNNFFRKDDFIDEAQNDMEMLGCIHKKRPNPVFEPMI